jgi:cysteine desulfurase
MGRVMKLREKGERDIHLLYLPSTHASVIETVRALEAQGVIAESLRIRDGAIDLEALDAQLRPETRMVVLDAICGETGTVYDTRGVRNVLEAHAKRTGASRSHLHVDASQTPLARPFDLTRLAADSVALDAQKVGGVRGAGALCMRSNIELAPIMHGGGQERGLRPGTEPVALMAAFARALETATQERESFVARAALARQRLVARMSATISNVLVNQGREGVPHILNVSLPGRDTDYLVMLLDKSGFSVATKSACETDSEQGSRAVLALTDDEERARSTLRISWGPTTRERDLERFADALISAVRFLDAAAGKRT